MFNDFSRALLTGAASVAAMTITMPAAAQSLDVMRSFDIAEQSLDDALIQFSRQSDVQVVTASANLGATRASAVQGELTPRQALDRLLAQTHLHWRQVAPGSIVVEPTADAGESSSKRTEQTQQVGTGPVDSAAEVLTEVVVTGSRLRRSENVTPIPVTVVDQEQISLSGATGLDQIANDIPALGESINSRSNFTNNADAGTSLLNLRGLGAQRTLVLVDGRRHVGSVAGNTAVDLNTIPVALIERVEVSTGGASTAYGADGVSGVVNIILRDDFEGVRFDAQRGQTSRDDGANDYGSLTAGTNFAEDRGNVTMNVTYSRERGIAGADRSYITDDTSFGANPANTGNADGVPAQVLYDHTRVNSLSTSGILMGATTGDRYTFTAAGALRPYDLGVDIGDDLSIGGDGLAVSRLEQVQNPLTRFVVAERMKYSFSPAATFFVDAKFANVRGTNIGQGFVDQLTIGADNPFLPDDPLITSLFAANPDGVELARYSDDLGGAARRDSERKTFRVVTGLQGAIPGTSFSYEGYYQYGQSRSDLTDFNTRLNRRFDLAVDAVSDVAGVVPGNVPGAAACRASVAAYTADAGGAGDPDVDRCQPLNLFGPGRASQAAIDYVLVSLHERDRLEQQVVNFTVNGDLWELPAGAVSAVAGVEWREEKSSSAPDTLQVQDLVYEGQALPASGSYDVLEAFTEASVPLLRGLRLAEQLSIEGGVRVSDYSTIGESSAWRVGAQYAPVKSLRFRGGYSVAVRAPNIGELFAPAITGSSGVLDPCDVNNLDLGPNPAQRRANCALLVPPGYVDPMANLSKPTHVSGNPDLQEEEAKTFTAGLVFEPAALPGFSATLDYFDIEITGAIQQIRARAFASGCVDFFANVQNDFCDKVTRDPVTGEILSIEQQPVNVAALKLNGIDFNLGYSMDLADYGLRDSAGVLGLRAYGTYLHRFDELPSPDPNQINHNAGETTAPKWRINTQATYRRGALAANWTLRYLGATELDVQDDPIETTDPQGFGAQLYHDIQVRYETSQHFTLFAGVNNLFDKQPPRGSRVFSDRAAALYEQVGSYYYAGVSARY